MDFVVPLVNAVAQAVPPLRVAFVVIAHDTDLGFLGGSVILDDGPHRSLFALPALACIERAFGSSDTCAVDEDGARVAVRAHAGAALPAHHALAVCELPRGSFRRIVYYPGSAYAAYLVGALAGPPALPPLRAGSLPWYDTVVFFWRPLWSVDVSRWLGANLSRCTALAVRAMNTHRPYALIPTHAAGADPDLPVETASGGWQVFATPFPASLALSPVHDSAVVSMVRIQLVATERTVGDVPYRRWKGFRRAFVKACACDVLEPEFRGLRKC